MHYAIIAHDKPDSVALRMAKRNEHRAYLHGDLSAHGAKIVFSGPLLAADQETPIGSLVVVDAPTIDDARAVLAGDPYEKAELFAQVDVMPWRFAIGQR
jgi:uncharacterized protein